MTSSTSHKVSRAYLPDVNVWIAIASMRSPHHEAAREWFYSTPKSSFIFFCRITQLSMLRLLTNKAAMSEDVVSMRRAWAVYDSYMELDGVDFAPEPFSVDDDFRLRTQAENSSTQLWTDAYLAAFAAGYGFTLVTFDKALSRISPGSLLLR